MGLARRLAKYLDSTPTTTALVPTTPKLHSTTWKIEIGIGNINDLHKNKIHSVYEFIFTIKVIVITTAQSYTYSCTLDPVTCT